MKILARTRVGGWSVLRRVVGVWLAVALALGTVVVPEAWAADYYVNPTTGNDGNAGTAAAPWKTLTHALGQVVATDVIHLAAGTYDTPGNGETFSLALLDGVAILGDPANPASVVISAPVGLSVFDNNDTPLGASTRLAGVTLRHDADTGEDEPMMLFAVDTATMSPQIDHNVFAGSTTEDADEAIRYWDAGSGDGVFTPTIDNNTFTDLLSGTWMYSLVSGSGNDFSPVITNNTFTNCDYPILYTMSTSAEGTVGGLVQGNTFSGTIEEDIYIYFGPYYGAGDLMFNPTITGNDMQSGAATNIIAYLDGFSHSGNATFAPTITDNTMDAGYYNIVMVGDYLYIDGDYTVAPTISGNTMTGASSAAVSLDLTTLSVSTTDQRNVLSPTITNNTMTPAGGEGVDIFLSDWSYGRIEGTATIAGNTITNASNGIDWEMEYMSDGTGMDWSIVMSNNTITSPDYDGIYFGMSSMSFSGTGTFNLTVEGNTITDAGGYGIDAYPAYSWYSGNTIAETVLIRGNTVTGSTYAGMYLYFSDQTDNTLDARITDNVVTDNGTNGLEVESHDLGSNGIRVACNVVTGNGVNGIYQGNGGDPPADYGGGNLSSPGGNVLMNNAGFDFSNQDGDPVKAEHNWWGSTDAVTIDGHIHDDDEGIFGAVDFDPFLPAAPALTIGATLTDSVANDVAPTGPSVGDTLLYTAVIASTGACGDASVSFTAPVDANTTVVPGSVTTTRGIVQSEDPPTVAVGVVPGGEPMTITWQVLVNGGTQVQTQGTVAATRTGTTLTDDPEVGGTTDPTVTTLVQAASGTVQFSVAAISVSEGAGTVTLEVTRTGGSTGSITVNYASGDGTAVAPGDYGAVSGQLNWADQDTANKQIVVPIVDDADIEGDETFLVTLTDEPVSSFVGTPATATVTIQDNEQASPIPTLGQWGLILFAGLLLLLGGWLLRRRRWAETVVVLLLMAAMAAAPVWAAGDAKPKAKEVHATTVAGFTLAEGTATIVLADGASFTAPRAEFKVRPGHLKRAKGEARVQQTREERHQMRIARRAESAHAARLASLKAGTPVLVTVKLDKRDGKIKRIEVLTFATPEQAQAELARKQAGKKGRRD